MNKKYTYLIIVLLVLISFIAFGRSVGNDFINYDDDRLITENIKVQTGFTAESIKWALTNSSHEYWHPLTWLAIMLEWQLFGKDAFGYHIVSLLLHIGAMLLLFLFLNKSTNRLWPSAFAAAFFALHPLRVESVAWAAEFKDVLSMFFGMATLYAYAFYVEERKLSKYFLCLILFILALLSKPMMVTLPCVMLLLDYWPLCRLQKALTPQSIPISVENKTGNNKMNKKLKNKALADKKITNSLQCRRLQIKNILWEKIPFFSLALAFGIMIILQLKADKYLASTQQVSFSDRLGNALVSYVSYLGKTFWPVDLAVFYPYVSSLPMWQVFGSALLLLSITVAVIFLIKRAPFLAVGWFWYLGTLFPVSGLMQAGDQAMADRYTYLPSVGICIMLAWGVIYLLPQESIRKKILFPAAGIVLFILTFLTWQQCGYWKNSVSLFSHALRATENNYLAHTNLGVALDSVDKKEAVSHYYSALRINPKFDKAHYNMANVLKEQGKIEEAISHYSSALRINPKFDKAHYNVALVLKEQGKFEEAFKHFQDVLFNNPNMPDVHNNIGIILESYFNKYDEAIYYYEQELNINNNHGTHYNLGIALAKKGKLQEAMEHFRQAIYLKPDFEDARRALRYAQELEQGQKR